MDKNDFDIDFDFEKEYGLDPELLQSTDDDFDYDQFLRDDLDLGLDEVYPVESESDSTQAFQLGTDGEVPEEETYEEEVSEEYDEDEDLSADFVRPASYEGDFEEESETEYIDSAEDPESDYTEEDYVPSEEGAYDEEEESERVPRRKLELPKIAIPKISLPNIKWPIKKEGHDEKMEYTESTENEEGEQKPRRRRESKPKEPTFFSKLLDAYMEPVHKAAEREKEEQVLDPLDPRVLRRRKRDKKKIFKEVYLPAIIAGIALFLILSFCVGAVANAVRTKKLDDAAAELEAQNQANADAIAEQKFGEVIAEVDRLAAGYDYDKALDVLNEFDATTEKFDEEVQSKRSELVNAQGSLQEWKDTSQIANLSFHVLIADPARAFQKSVAGDLAGSYNKNFVTTEEFSRILNQLYTGNYVLVDFNSFVSTSDPAADGSVTYFGTSMWLPAGKKPIMITETLVNYLDYMVDPNKDGVPDAGGHGFANKLVVTSSGDIKASLIDASGNELIGNYDLVPILEDFIAEHPDFSYRGARATLAVTGDQGVFGYRTNTSYVATKGQSYYDEQVALAKLLVDTLREKGYTIASYTYSNQAYRGMSTVQIQAEMQNWTSQCTPILGDVDVMVFARSSDIDAYSGTSFNVLYDTGFRFFLNNGTSPRVDINTTFVKQTRLMVTGESMAWYSNQFMSYFDSNMVLDLSTRGNVPRS